MSPDSSVTHAMRIMGHSWINFVGRIEPSIFGARLLKLRRVSDATR